MFLCGIKKLKLVILFLFLSCHQPLVQAVAPEINNLEVGFSPEGSAHFLVLKTIKLAKYNIRMMAYSFTDPDIIKELVNAYHRGVDIKIVVDEKGNKGKASRAAMNFIVNSGIQLKTNNHFSIQHDKILIVDNNIVETGSYNFTKSAAKKNSENVIVIKYESKIANEYLAHWKSRWDMGKYWKSLY